jgi:malate dehydrogenase
MRVTIWGAGGKVGKQAVQHLLLNGLGRDVELVLLGRNVEKMRGHVADVLSTIPLVATRKRGTTQEPDIVITDDYHDLRGSALVILAFGQWPTARLRTRFAALDESGRLVQAYTNLNLVRDACRRLAEQCPKATVVVVTNQSDLMSAAARESLHPAKVLGLGGMCDSARFRSVAGKVLALPKQAVAGAHLVGFHNHEMLPLSSTMSFDADARTLADILDQTRRYGSSIARLQRDPKRPGIDSGASVLPGYAVYATIGAYTGAIKPIEEAFNVVLPRQIARTYGTAADHALSVPIRISRNSFEVISTFSTTATERRMLRQCQRNLENVYSRLLIETQPRGR